MASQSDFESTGLGELYEQLVKKEEPTISNYLLFCFNVLFIFCLFFKI